MSNEELKSLIQNAISDICGKMNMEKQAIYQAGYDAGYQMGYRVGRRSKKDLPPVLEDTGEIGNGYVCQLCGIQRPKNYYFYHVELVGQGTVTPVCALCARKHKSKGPFRQQDGSPVS